MKAKRAVSIIMALFLIAGSIITGSALSDSAPRLYIQLSNDTAYVGDIIKASVVVDRLKSFSSYQINLKYDPSVLEPCDPDTGIPFDNNTHTKGDTVLNNEEFNPTPVHKYDFEKGLLNFGKGYLDVEGYRLVAPPESSGTLAVIGFRVKKAATTQISFADTYAVIQKTGSFENDNIFNFLGGGMGNYKIIQPPSINCIEAPVNTPVPTNVVTPGGLLLRLSANVDKSLIKEGDIVKYTLSIMNFRGFAGFHANIKYDPSVFQPVDPYTGEAYTENAIPATYGELLCNEEFMPISIKLFDFKNGLFNIGRAYMDLEAYKESGLEENTGKILEVGFKALKTPTEGTFISLQNTYTMPDAVDGTIVYTWDNHQIRYQVWQAGEIRGCFITPTPTPSSTPTPTPTTQSESKISLLLDRDFAKTGDIITAKVVANEISHFCGYQVNLRFDPGKLKPIDLSTGKALNDSSRIGGNELLNNTDYFPVEMQRHNIKKGILNFGRAYMSKHEYLECGPEETSGVLAVIGFEVINGEGVDTSVLFADDPSMPDAIDGTYIFKGDIDVYAKDYKVIQAKPIRLLPVEPTPTMTPTPATNASIVMTVDKPGTKAGEVITAVISVKDITGFTGYQVNIKYDPLSLQPIDPNTLEPFDQKTAITGNTILNNTSYSPLSLKKYDFKEGILNFARGYMDYNLYKQNGPYESSGIIAVISFRVIKDSEKQPTLEFADTESMPGARQGTLLYNYNGSSPIKDYQIVKETKQEPVITPTPVVTSNNARISIIADKKAAKVGDIIKATVRVDDVKGLIGYQFNLKYDPKLLEAIDLATGKPLTKSSKLYGDELLRNSDYSPCYETEYDLKAGVLNIGKLYLDQLAYRNSEQKESSGVLAVIGFRVLKSTNAPVSIMFAYTECMPDANCGTYLFNCYSDTFMKDYQVIQQARVVITDIPATAFKYGDVDGDGIVTSTDYALVLRYILGMIGKDGFKNGEMMEAYKYGYLAADVDGTHITKPESREYLTSTDLAYIKRKLLGMIDIFPAETMK